MQAHLAMTAHVCSSRALADRRGMVDLTGRAAAEDEKVRRNQGGRLLVFSPAVPPDLRAHMRVGSMPSRLRIGVTSTAHVENGGLHRQSICTGSVSRRGSR